MCRLRQEPRQGHFDAQRVLQHLYGPGCNLSEGAHLKPQRISFPGLLLDRDELPQLTFGAGEALFETAGSLDLSESMADDDGDGFAHGRCICGSREQAFTLAAKAYRVAVDAAILGGGAW